MRKALGILLLLLAPLDLRGSGEVRTILVFPFENQSSRPDLNWISESFPVMLSSRLARPENYTLGREERDAACLQLGLSPETPLTLASEFRVAQTLGADWAIVGSFNVQGDLLTARAQLLDMRRPKLAPALEETGQLAELADLQTLLAWRLLGMHDPDFTVGKEEDFASQFPPLRLDAFENYVRGLVAGDDEARIHFFQEADRLDPADHRAAFALGRLEFDRKEYADSAKWLQKLQEADAPYLESRFLLGVDEFFLGHEAAAEKAFQALAGQIPLNEVWNNLGVLKARRGRYAEALAAFDRAYQSDPGDPDFCFNRGATLWYLKRYKEAAQALEEAVRVNDEDSEAHTLLAVVLKKLGDAAGEQRETLWLAEHEVGLAAELHLDILPRPRLKKQFDGRAFHLLALALHNAMEERLASVPPAQHSEVHIARGKKFLAEGRLPEAERELAEAVTLVPGSSEAHVSLAQVLEAEGKYREAAAELETSLQLKDSVAAHLVLARVYLALEQPQRAREQGQVALTLDPGNQQAEQLLEQIEASPPVRKTP
jgi:tetratricopeptide (TPR) repeat protein